MPVISVQRTIDGVLTSADTATLTVTDRFGITMITPVVVPPTSAGVYSYDTQYIQAGIYTATWTFVTAGFQDDVITRIFTVDPPVNATRGVTLADIERAIARRAGPYGYYKAASGSGEDTLLIRKLRTSIDIGDYEDNWILRRGRLIDNSLVPSFDTDDRQRLVAAYTPAFGLLEPERSWANAAIEDEAIELHYFDPEAELREFAKHGLSRCYFWDNAEIAIVTTTFNREVNVTASVPWITMPHQIRNVEFATSGLAATRLMEWKAFQMGPNVYLKVQGLPFGNLRIAALRPHATLVNGETSFQGPDDDDDVLHVSLEYAARAGHIAAWMMATEKLTVAAAEGLRLPMKMVADAFTQASYAYVRNEPELLQISWGMNDLMMEQVGNA